MTAYDGILQEHWAIEPSWLPKLIAIARRQHVGANIGDEARAWTKRDFVAMAGPGAKQLSGAQRALINDGVAVLPLVGPIFPRANLFTEMSGATALSTMEHDLRVALASAEVKGILLN